MAEPLGIFFGLVFIGAGVAIAAKPYSVARFNEIIDAIGSTTPPSEVEPAGWRVTMTKLSGIGGIFVGLFFILTAM